MQYLTPHKIRGILKTPTRGTPQPQSQDGIFSFTEISGFPESSIKKRPSQGRNSHVSSLTDLDNALQGTPKALGLTPKSERSLRSQRKVKITVTKGGSLSYLDEEDEGGKFENTVVSTMPSLNGVPSDAHLTVMTEDDIIDDHPDELDVQTAKKDVKDVKEEVRPLMSLKRIKTKAKSLLVESKELKENFEKMSELRNRVEDNYEKTMENLGDKLTHPVVKFDYWKRDKNFIKERSTLQNEIGKFRGQVKESRKELERLQALDQYLQTEDWGEHEERENDKFDKVEKTILKEARPFRIKRQYGRSIQIESRSKPDSNTKVDFGEIDMLLKSNRDGNADRKETEEEDSEEKKARMKINKKHLEKFSEIEFVFSKMKGEWKERPTQGIDEIYKQIGSISERSDLKEEEGVGSNKVYYFTGIKNLRGHCKGLKKDQVERKCTPGAVEPKPRAYNFKDSYTAFKKSSLSRRNQKEI